MFGPRLGSTFKWGTILSNTHKTLGVINQVIPIYKEAKPMINNARNAINIVKEFSNTTTNKIITNKEKNIKPIKEKINTIKSANLTYGNTPTFFQ